MEIGHMEPLNNLPPPQLVRVGAEFTVSSTFEEVFRTVPHAGVGTQLRVGEHGHILIGPSLKVFVNPVCHEDGQVQQVPIFFDVFHGQTDA